MKRAIILVSAVAALAVPLTTASASAAGPQNIVQVAAANKKFSTLVTLVKKAGLVKALSPEGQSRVPGRCVERSRRCSVDV